MASDVDKVSPEASAPARERLNIRLDRAIRLRLDLHAIFSEKKPGQIIAELIREHLPDREDYGLPLDQWPAAR